LGLINRAMGDAVALCPPLIISDDEIHEMFEMIEKAIDRTEAWVTKENLRAA
jgi:4-aminobutyrate--pyruvate transaminase